MASQIANTLGRRREIVAGLTSFAAMSYIIVVNPAILSSEGTGIPYSGALTATIVVAVISTLLMAVARLPFGVAPGMGLNSFFAMTIIVAEKIPVHQALGVCFWAGVMLVIITSSPLQRWILVALPPAIRVGAIVGIGFYLAHVALSNSGFTMLDYTSMKQSDMKGLSFLLALLGLAVMLVLQRRGSPLSVLAGMAAVTLAANLLGYGSLPKTFMSWPDFSMFLQLDLVGARRVQYLPAMLAIVFTTLLDCSAFLTGFDFGQELTDRRTGMLKNLYWALVINALATLFAALAGCSPAIVFFENLAGLKVGGRTWLTAVTIAICFVPFLFLGPLIQIVAPAATVSVLLFVGTLMFESIARLKFDALEEWAPAFLTVVFIVTSGSIGHGLIYGFIAHTVLHLCVGKFKEVHAVTSLMAFFGTVLLVVEHYLA